MNEYYFTFGQGHIHHDVDMKDYYIRIKAKTSEEARQSMFNNYGQKWSMEYTKEEFQPQYFPNGEFRTIVVQ